MLSHKNKKRNRKNVGLFNPYENGISNYDLAFLSSKRISKSKFNNKKVLSINKEYFAA